MLPELTEKRQMLPELGTIMNSKQMLKQYGICSWEELKDITGRSERTLRSWANTKLFKVILQGARQEKSLPPLPPPKQIKSKPKLVVHNDTAKLALDYLNQKTGRNFRPTKANINAINARIKGGATLDQIRAVIDVKWDDWGKDDKMRQYLRPITIFRESNFDNYLVQASEKTGVTTERQQVMDWLYGDEGAVIDAER